VADRFSDPILTPLETAYHLSIPERTVYHWLRQEARGRPLVHSVRPEHAGWPSVPSLGSSRRTYCGLSGAWASA